MTDKWKADPTRGESLVEPRRAEVVAKLKDAADVAYFHIDEETTRQIEDIKKKAGEQKAKISRAVHDAETKPAMTVVRKYWNESPDVMWKHFVYEMTK